MDFKKLKEQFNEHAERTKYAVGEAALKAYLTVVVRPVLAFYQIKDRLSPSFWGSLEEGDVKRIEKALRKNPKLATQHLDSAETNPALHIYPLHVVAGEGHTDVARVLLKYGADLAQLDGRGISPLLLASCSGHKEVVELFLQHKDPTLNQPVFQKTTTALMGAAENGYPDIVKLLVQNGAKHDMIVWGEKDALTIVKECIKYGEKFITKERMATFKKVEDYLETLPVNKAPPSAPAPKPPGMG